MLEVINLNITYELTKFLNISSLISESTIILTDLDKTIFVASNKPNNYLNNYLSDDLKNIINFYCIDLSCEDYINTTLDSIVPITNNDTINAYKSQIILPITHRNILDGLLIFLADNRYYLPSNLNYAKTTRHFVEIFTDKIY